MKRLERVALGLAKPINPYSVVILGAMTFFWGLWIVNPFWDVFSHAAIFSKAAEFAPEWAWGTWATASGAFTLFGIFSARYKCLISALSVLMWHWWTIAGFYWWGDWQNTAVLTYSFVALFSTYAWLNMKLNKKELTHFDGR